MLGKDQHRHVAQARLEPRLLGIDGGANDGGVVAQPERQRVGLLGGRDGAARVGDGVGQEGAVRVVVIGDRLHQGGRGAEGAATEDGAIEEGRLVLALHRRRQGGGVFLLGLRHFHWGPARYGAAP